MPYRVEIPTRVRRQIPRWPMPDVLLVDCYERLMALRDNPAQQLDRFVDRPLLADILHEEQAIAIYSPSDLPQGLGWGSFYREATDARHRLQHSDQEGQGQATNP